LARPAPAPAGFRLAARRVEVEEAELHQVGRRPAAALLVLAAQKQEAQEQEPQEQEPQEQGLAGRVRPAEPEASIAARRPKLPAK
jgi:hypothetical protein